MDRDINLIPIKFLLVGASGEATPGGDFDALCPTVPRIGDEIDAANGRTCIVTRILYRLISNPAIGSEPVAYASVFIRERA